MDPFTCTIESPVEEGFREGFDQGLVEGKRLGWLEGFEQGLPEGAKLGSRIGSLLVPLLTICNSSIAKEEFKTSAQELIDTLSRVSLQNEEDPESLRDQTLSQVEAKTKALVANFSKHHPQLLEDDRRRLKPSTNSANNKTVDLF